MSGFIVYLLMIVPTDQLDHLLRTRRDLLRRVAGIEKTLLDSSRTGISQCSAPSTGALVDVRNAIIQGGTTGDLLKDWAILHSFDYHPVFEQGRQLQAYLAEHARAPTPSLVAVYQECSFTRILVEYSLHIGVLSPEGMAVSLGNPPPPLPGVYVTLADHPQPYHELGNVLQSRHVSFQIERKEWTMVDIYRLLTGGLTNNPAGSTLYKVNSVPPECPFPFRFFSVREETPPHCQSLVFAGTDAVRAYLHKFWDGKEPREATEFFRQITQRITCEPAP